MTNRVPRPPARWDRPSIQLLVTLLALACITGCASSGPTIVTNKDPVAEFERYKTFDFMQPLSTDRNGVRTIVSSQLISSTMTVLEAKGLTRDQEDPDLLVNFFVSAETRNVVRTTPTATTSMSWRRGRYRPWPGYTSMSLSNTQTTTSSRTDGTLAVDLVSPEKNLLVWEGSAQGRVTDEVRENQAEALDTAIQKIFAEFP